MAATRDRANLIATAKGLSPDAKIMVRLRYLRELEKVRRLGANRRPR